MRTLAAWILAAGTIFAAAPALAAGWNVEVVDEEGDVGSYCALTIDSLDRAVVAYRDERFRTARIKRKTAAGWGHAVVPPDPDSNFGIWNALAADGAGGFHLVYSGLPDYRMKHVSFDGAAWSTIEDVFQGGPYTDIELDSQGGPHIVFDDFPGGFVTYTYRDGAIWPIQFLGTMSYGAFTSLALDVDDVPYVAYRRFDYPPPDALVLARRLSDGTWEEHDVVTLGAEDPKDLSLALDPLGRVHIAYHDDLGGKLVYYRGDGVNGTFTVVDSGGVGEWVTMAVDDALVPHIAYYDAVNGDLRYVRGDDWLPVVVDSTGDVGRYASLALDAAGLPHVAYYDKTNGNLRHAWVEAPTSAGARANGGDFLAVRPNPFRAGGGVEISLVLPRASPVDLRVYDVQGRLVRTLARRSFGAGAHAVRWDGRRDGGEDAVAGVYFVRLRADGTEARSRVVKIR